MSTRTKTQGQPAQLIPGTLMTDKSIAAALAVSKTYVWENLVKNKILTPIRLTPKTTRFRADEAIALINKAAQAI